MKINKTTFISACAAILLTSACSTSSHMLSTHTQAPDNAVLGGKLYSSAWIQRSAEYKALCMQAYNIAELRLNEALLVKEKNSASKPLAVVTDIDETMLDNTPNSVHQAFLGKDYEEKSWNEWCHRAEADTLCGALHFFRYAHSKGVEVFYISNRSEADRAGTLENLKKFGFPQTDDQHLLLRQGSSNKQSRRDAVLSKYDIVLLLGDNLGDFDHVYDDGTEAMRHESVVKQRAEFGKKFIVLPNPNYGTWEKAMNGGYPTLDKRNAILKEKLKAY